MKLPVKLLVAAALTLGVAACGPSGDNKTAAGGSKPVTLFQWEDYMDPPFYADYEKAAGEHTLTGPQATPQEDGEWGIVLLSAKAANIYRPQKALTLPSRHDDDRV